MEARREMSRLIWLLVLVGKCSPFQVSPHAFKTLRSQPHATAPPSHSLLSSCAGSLLPATIGRAPGSLSRNSRTCASSRIDLTMNKDATATFVDGLLCQRSVQTQLYYFAEFRDGFKKQWLENFLDHEGLMNYHGFGGLKVDTNEYLSSMLHSPPVEHEVKMSWGNRLGGGSKDNPYLQQQPKFNSYKETIHPQKICKGLMDIREQLKIEWLTDLPVMKEEDAMFLYQIQLREEAEEEALKTLRDNGGESDDDGNTQLIRSSDWATPKRKKKGIFKHGNWDWSAYGDAQVNSSLPKIDGGDVPAGLEDMARQQRAAEAVGGMMNFNEDDDHTSSLVRDDIMLLGIRGVDTSNDQSSTPLRAKNYDVLKKGSTYIAVKQIMNKWARDPDMEGALQWFTLTKWQDNYKNHLLQDSGRHIADRFLKNLAESPSVAVTAPKLDTLQMVTPANLAMDIIEERARVIDKFLAWLNTSDVEQGHIELQRELLAESLSSDAPKAALESQKAGFESLFSLKTESQTQDQSQGEDLESIWKPQKNQQDGTPKPLKNKPDVAAPPTGPPDEIK